MPKAVDDALARSRTLAIELVPQAADGEVSELERLDNGARLEPLIGAEPFAQLRRELSAQRVPLPVIEHMKPWAALVKIASVPGAASGRSLDEQLLAALAGIPQQIGKRFPGMAVHYRRSRGISSTIARC